MVILALIVNAAVLFAAFLAGLMIRRGSRRQCLVICAVALALCLSKGILSHHPDVETRLFPWPDYVMYGGWIGPLAMLALGAMAGLVRRRRDWLFIVIGGAVTMAYFGDYLGWLAPPARPVLGIAPRSTTFYCQQTTPYTCGPAAAATMLRRASNLSIETDEREMAALCLTREGRGTLDLGLYRGLNLKLERAGAEVRVRVVRLTFEELLRAPKPCMLRVRFGFDHAVVVVDTEGSQIVVFDPAAPGRLHRWDRLTLVEDAGWGGYAFVFHRLDGNPLPPGDVSPHICVPRSAFGTTRRASPAAK